MKNTHSIGITSSLSSLFIRKSPGHMSNMSTVFFFFFFLSLEGENIYSGITFTIPGSGLDTTIVAGIETITNLESIWQARGSLGRSMPLVLSGRPLSCWPLSLPRCWNEETEFPTQTLKFLLSGVALVSPSLPPHWGKFSSFAGAFSGPWPSEHVDPGHNTRDNQGSLLYAASLGFRWQYKTSLVKM